MWCRCYYYSVWSFTNPTKGIERYSFVKTLKWAIVNELGKGDCYERNFGLKFEDLVRGFFLSVIFKLF